MQLLRRLFGRKDEVSKRQSDPQRSPSTVIRDALARRGIQVGLPEIDKKITQVTGMIKSKGVLPEQLIDSSSETVQLSFTGTAYEVVFSLLLLDGGGNLAPKTAQTILSLATYYAVASELARESGRQEYCLSPGESIGLCDFIGSPGHPIHQLFPELLSKTAMV